MTTKEIGSTKARAQVKQITKRVLAHVKKLTPTDAAHILGLDVDDMRNMKQGNKFSVPMLFKMIRVGRFDPVSILEGPTLKKLKKSTIVPRATQQRLDDRIHNLAWHYPGKVLAKMTGLSVTGAYGLRYSSAHVTLYTVLGFIHAGYSAEELVFGPVIAQAKD